MNTKDFYMMPKLLARSDGFISKVTGEAVKLSASGKIIYTYMLTKNSFFVDKLNNQHYESQATIAKFCGVEYKSAGAILRTLLDHGVLEGRKLRPDNGGQWRWFYTKVYSDLLLWEGTVKDFKILEEEKPKYVEKSVPKPTIVNKPYQHQAEPDWDDSQLPF